MDTNYRRKSLVTLVVLVAGYLSLVTGFGQNVRVVPPPADVPLTLTTSATGTNWVAFANQAAHTVTIINDTQTKLAVRIGSTGSGVSLPDGAGVKVNVTGNANEVSIRRSDTSNTQVTVTAWAGR